MNVYTLFLFNLISASILLMTSSTPISDVNETIARKIDLATDDRAKDAPIQKFTLGEIASLFDMIDLLTNQKASKSRDHGEYLLSLLDEKYPESAELNYALPSSDETFKNNVATKSTVESKSQATEDIAEVSKRNPETELLKKLLSYKRKNRVSYVNRKLQCILSGLPGC